MDRSICVAFVVVMLSIMATDRTVHFLTGYSFVEATWRQFAPELMTATGD